MDKIEELINDAKLHVNEAERNIIEWNIKLAERRRILTTIEIIKGKKPVNN